MDFKREFNERFRLYIDESGDHVFKCADQIPHRFLCLFGTWFKNPEYLRFHAELEALKHKYLHHHPDEPVILHREDMPRARKAFKTLMYESVRKAWDDELLALIAKTEFTCAAVVIDKLSLLNTFQKAAGHPYHIGLGFLLQRFAGYLNHVNRHGDVMAESRGGEEDRRLKESYARTFKSGCWQFTADAFQRALTSKELKLKPKSANISGLQLSDILGYPAKQWVLRNYGFLENKASPFETELMKIVVAGKFNRRGGDGKIEGYGFVIYPGAKK